MEKILTLNYIKADHIEDLPADDCNLIAEAQKATELAYAKYSGFKVGAALLTEDGNIYTGVNVENSSYGATICAERTAFFKAISEGKREFLSIAICGGKDGTLHAEFPPCGVCRQVMREFCSDDFEIYLVSEHDIQTYTLGQLLPMSFRPDTIKEDV